MEHFLNEPLRSTSPTPFPAETESATNQGGAVEESLEQGIFDAAPDIGSDDSVVQKRICVYPSMGRRFCAYLADYTLIYFAALATGIAFGLAGSPLSSNDFVITLLSLLTLYGYMTVAQILCHTTAGKYIFGMEIVSQLPNRRYPRWSKILLRETLGRLVSSLFFGIGYWEAIGDPEPKPWSDRMAGTAVVFRTTKSTISIALTIVVSGALLVDLGATDWGFQQQEKQQRYQAVSNQMKSIGAKIATSRNEVERLVNAEPADFKGYQRNMGELKPWLDYYDSEVNQMQATIRTALNDDTISSPKERRQMQMLLRLWDIKKQQSQKRRDQAQLILGYSPDPRSVKHFQSELEMIDGDITIMEQQARQLVAAIQKD